MRHQLCSRTVDSAKSFLSRGFTCAGRSSASLNLCQSLALSSKCRASAISSSARTQALSKMKFVIFTPRRSAPRRISLASRSLTRKLSRSVRFRRALIAGTSHSQCTYTRHLTYVQCTPHWENVSSLARPLLWACDQSDSPANAFVVIFIGLYTRQQKNEAEKTNEAGAAE